MSGAGTLPPNGQPFMPDSISASLSPEIPPPCSHCGHSIKLTKYQWQGSLYHWECLQLAAAGFPPEVPHDH